MVLEVLASVSHFAVTTPALVGICLGATLFLVTVAAVTCFCYRRHTRLVGGKKGLRGMGPEKPLALHQYRRPTAVKSPAGMGVGTGTHYLKKSPSPTGGTRSPPAPSGSGTPSPTSGQILTPQSANSPVQESPQQIEPSEKETTVYHTENEIVDKPTTPSKEELETNEKNLTASEGGGGKLGKLFFRLRYKREKSALVVTVVKCQDLPAKDPNLGSSDPYVKLQLLPDKQHKVKTRVLRKTRNPVYDEDFTFYGITVGQLEDIILHFVVLSFDRYSRDDIIGEVFSSVNLSLLGDNQQKTICRQIHPRSLKIKAMGRGELLVSLCWQPAANRLTVVVLKARNLPKMDVTGLADPYVKMYLLYNNQRIAKKKTHVKRRTLNPVFNESFVFTIPAGAEGLDNVSLEFLLLDWDRVTKNEVIGRLELGSAKSTGSALHHWNEVCNSPRRQIADWHKLEE
ncbi:synaptotagmin-4 isoform X2 [Anabrus simplex]|uniref:synaptotagmin-4 isoform X2 n=1 Tax=Anabrus simplex TaxID=316456 RepID=UPI0034DCEDAF